MTGEEAGGSLGARSRWRVPSAMPMVAAAITTVLAIAALLVVDRLERERLDIARRVEVATQLDTLRARLEQELVEPLELSRGLVAFVQARGDITQAEFDRIAPTLVGGQAKGRRLSLARGTVIAMIYPLAGNEAAIGVDYRTVPKQWPTVEQVMRTRRPALNGPVPLIQGGTGLIVRAPIFVPDSKGGEDRFFGIATVVLDVDKIFDRAGIRAGESPITVAIRGKDGLGANGEMIVGDEAVFRQAPVVADVLLPYGSWHMAAIPKGGWGSANRTEIYLLRTMGLFLVLLVATATFGAAVYQRQRAFAEASTRLRLETAVKERTAELRKILQAVEQSPNIVFITDLDGTIQYVNPRFSELTGYGPDEAVGANPRLLKSGDTPVQVYRDMWDTIRTCRPWRSEMKDRRKDGQVFWAEVTIAPIRDEAGNLSHFLAIHEDITHRKLAEAEVLMAKEQAIIANRAKSELLANMSHELRTPLNAIIGFSTVLKDEIFGPYAHPRQKEYIGDILASGEHLLELINDILDVSAIEAGKLALSEEEFALDEICTSTLRLVAPRAEKGGVRLFCVLAPDLPLLRADQRRLKQALLNLVSNGVKFTPENGSVTISVRRLDNGDLEIVVTDTGIGMDAKELAMAMERFGQVDSGLGRKYEGTGLGLPLTKELVELHGGSLTLASKRHVGTTATIRLPAGRLIPG